MMPSIIILSVCLVVMMALFVWVSFIAAKSREESDRLKKTLDELGVYAYQLSSRHEVLMRIGTSPNDCMRLLAKLVGEDMLWSPSLTRGRFEGLRHRFW